jgi:hypothetical protein
VDFSGVDTKTERSSRVPGEAMSRRAPGLSMKIQVKDCATGGIFQMNIPCSGILTDGTPVVCKGANPDGTVTMGQVMGEDPGFVLP